MTEIIAYYTIPNVTDKVVAYTGLVDGKHVNHAVLSSSEAWLDYLAWCTENTPIHFNAEGAPWGVRPISTRRRVEGVLGMTLAELREVLDSEEES